MDGKGYLLPDNLEPDEDSCLLVWFPDAPEYRRALLGSISTLGTWIVWEKRGDNSASVAAARWKESIIRTINQKFDCELVDLLDEEGTMTITITNSQSQTCGCCGGDGSGFYEPPPGSPPGEVVVVPPTGVENPTDEGTGMSEGELCDTGAYLASSFVSVFLDMEAYWSPITVTSGVVFEYLKARLAASGGGALTAASFTTWMLSTLSLAITGAVTGGWIARTSDAAQQYQNEFACAIATATSGAAAKKQWWSVLSQIRLTYGPAVYNMMWIVSHLWNWDKVVAGEVAIPLDFQGSNCNCGDGDGWMPFATSYEPALLNGWVGGSGGLTTPEGLQPGVYDFCENGAFCSSSSLLTFSTSGWDAWLRKEFIAHAEEMTFEYHTYTSDVFAPDLIARVRSTSEGVKGSKTTDPPTGVNVETLTATNLIIGNLYRFEIAGNKRRLLYCDLI